MRLSSLCLPIAACLGLVCASCGSEEPSRSSHPTADAGPDASTGEYRATVRWTSYGIPHVTAENYSALAYGVAYAESRDFVCILADQILRVRSERARYFGAGEADRNVESDFAFLGAGVYETAEETYVDLDEATSGAVTAFATGYNDHLADTPSAQLPPDCAGQEWVKPITPVDLWAYYYWVGLFGSVDPLLNFISAAQPPTTAMSSPAPRISPPVFDGPTSEPARFAHVPFMGVNPEVMGSNGWAIGAEKSATGRGMLIANPHFPWEGNRRFYEHHLTIPGVLDAYGVGLLATPLVTIGFSENVAWTHTVTTANHFTVYRLELAPDDPTQYLYDGVERAMTSREFTIEVKDGSSTTQRSRTLYRSHYGPMIAIAPALEWTTTNAYTFRDANERNVDLARTWRGMAEAKNLAEFEAIQEDAHGIPWVNTMAVSPDGTALYFDASRTPKLSASAETAYRDALVNDIVTAGVRQNGAVLLNGSDSTFEWVGEDDGRPGIVPYADSPRLERRDYVANANDSHWLTNPATPLTGFSKLFGDEATPRSPRTRMNLMMLEETAAEGVSGSDATFTFEELRAVPFANRASMAELLRDQVVARCAGATSVDVDGTPVDVAAGCSALESWDGRLNVESSGALVWREFLTSFQSLRDAGDLFAVAFDPGSPITTPNTLAAAPAGVADPVLVALGRAVLRLRDAGYDETTPLGDAQFAMRGTERIPIHGGSNMEGAFNIVGYNPNNGTLLPGLTRGQVLAPTSTLTPDGYPINNGTSFVMVLEFSAEGPRAEALLTYSQSPDPRSDFFADQTRRFSSEEWRPILFKDADIEADPNLLVQEIDSTK